MLGLSSYGYEKIVIDGQREKVLLILNKQHAQCVQPVSHSIENEFGFIADCNEQSLIQYSNLIGVQQEIVDSYRKLISLAETDSLLEGLQGIAFWVFLLGNIPWIWFVVWKFFLGIVKDISEAVKG